RLPGPGELLVGTARLRAAGYQAAGALAGRDRQLRPGVPAGGAGGRAQARGHRHGRASLGGGAAIRISRLSARIQAGNSSSTQGDIPTPTSRITAPASPARPSHPHTIAVRRHLFTVVPVTTGDI